MIRLLPLTVAAALVAAGSAPGAARAAEYTVTTCAGQPAALGGWAAFTTGGHRAGTSDGCQTPGPFAAVLAGRQAARPAGEVGWSIEAPPATAFGALVLTRRLNIAAEGYGYQLRETGVGGASPLDIQTCTGPAACAPISRQASVSWRAARPGVARLDFRVFCRPRAEVPCAATAGAEAASIRVTAADVSLSDISVPVVSAPSGSLVSGTQPVTGVREVTASASDTGGGVAALGLEVDGLVVSEEAVAASSCRQPYRTPVPCPRSVSTSLPLNAASVPDGTHTIRVFARDATRANVGYSVPFTVTTSARGAVNGVNGSDTVALEALARSTVRRGRRAPRARKTAELSFGSRSVVSGVLRDGARRPVGNARLAVAAAVDRGVPVWQDLPVAVATRPDGRFGFVLPAGPSRRVRISYFARSADTQPAARSDVRLKVAAKVTARASRRSLRPGGRTVFSGRVLGELRPAGVRVDVQARQGRRWRTISSAAAAADGRYRAGYRFTRGARGRFSFRVRVRHFPRFPYFVGASPAVRVRVR